MRIDKIVLTIRRKFLIICNILILTLNNDEFVAQCVKMVESVIRFKEHVTEPFKDHKTEPFDNGKIMISVKNNDPNKKVTMTIKSNDLK